MTASEFLLLLGPNPQPYIPELHPLDVLELLLSGGCPICEYEADEMCVGCGRCACDRHDACVRPDEGPRGQICHCGAPMREVGGQWVCQDPYCGASRQHLTGGGQG
ncbi:hypothetical protein [Streptomyces demainii]|uniref:Uncharacterized protein n=1 Tax=Streptomyces demainii TaxID=588122 RepID=A0ABT9L6S7_9ACTN|nr:hypothetical protein [Streptomyces demainii]MDP9616420.1 hypothetical protein [Streptomyces demainii]